MNIAVLGTGNVGSVLTDAFSAGGHSVALGSRTPDQNKGSVSFAEAVSGSAVVVTAVPGVVAVDTLEQVGDDRLAGKIILDVSNAFTPEFTLAYPNDSVARRIQERFPRSQVVKSLSTLSASVMVDPASVGGESTVFVSGDDEDAKATVRGLLADLGWPESSVLDLGGVATAMGPEHYGLLFMGAFAALQTPSFNIKIVR